MPIEKWKTISRKDALVHPRIHLVEDEVELPNGKAISYVRYAPGVASSVAVIAVNDDGDILLQQEYSYPPDEVMWQLPGGAVEQGEDVLVAAKRELSEESHLTAADCRLIGSFYVDNRRSDRKQYVVVARGLSELVMASDPEEFIESYWVPEMEVKQRIRDGEFDNINLLAGLNLWFHTKK